MVSSAARLRSSPFLQRAAHLEKYLYLVPALAFVAIFLLYPAGDTIYISLTNWDGLNPPHFIGFQNYHDFFQDPVFKTSFENTLIWVIATLLFPVLWGLGMAVLISRIKFEGFFKTIFYLPYAISATSTSVMCST